MIFEKDLYYSAVVRIRSIGYIFDWFEPYKKENSISTGSGFFINSEGYILTNNHVVDQAIKLYITIPIEGNNEFEADIICVHPELDLALIKIINYKNKFHFKLSDSHLINVGQRVIALGFPLGSSTLKLTKGVISGFENRLIQRNQDNIDIISKRLKAYDNDIRHWSDYDHVIINDNLEHCFSQIEKIITSEIK